MTVHMHNNYYSAWTYIYSPCSNGQQLGFIRTFNWHPPLAFGVDIKQWNLATNSAVQKNFRFLFPLHLLSVRYTFSGGHFTEIKVIFRCNYESKA